MTDVLYDVLGVETGIRDQARLDLPEAIQDGIYAGILPPKALPPYVLFTVRAPHAEGLMMSGDQTLDLTVSWTCAGKDHAQAVGLGTAVRQWLLGRDPNGAFSHPIPLDEHRAVLQRAGNTDGAPDNAGGVQQWTETAQLTIGRK